MAHNVILADPPWEYNTDMVGGSKSLDHYPSMKLRDMMHIPVTQWCSDRCVLYMWTTAPKMRDAIRLGEAWGFVYSTVAFVWDKQRICPGNYTITECEFVLVFRPKHGKLPKRAKTNARQFFQEKPREHSRKPEYVQDMIDLMYPDSAKLELFARRSRPGWDSWGNETTKFD